MTMVLKGIPRWPRLHCQCIPCVLEGSKFALSQFANLPEVVISNQLSEVLAVPYQYHVGKEIFRVQGSYVVSGEVYR